MGRGLEYVLHSEASHLTCLTCALKGQPHLSERLIAAPSWGSEDNVSAPVLPRLLPLGTPCTQAGALLSSIVGTVHVQEEGRPPWALQFHISATFREVWPIFKGAYSILRSLTWEPCIGAAHCRGQELVGPDYWAPTPGLPLTSWATSRPLVDLPEPPLLHPPNRGDTNTYLKGGWKD